MSFLEFPNPALRSYMKFLKWILQFLELNAFLDLHS